MAYVSVTTQLKRYLNAIEEAEVDTSLMKSRAPGWNARGIFPAYVRCCEIYQGIDEDRMGGPKVWTAEQDHTIALRSAMTGEVVKDVSSDRETRILPHKEMVRSFVVCMRGIGLNLWCGYGDGVLRVYNQETRNLICERRRHQGSINCILYAAGIESVFTGSHDFKILQWDVREVKVVRQFSGSQNYINALTIGLGGEFLTSAGEDHYIRQWDLYIGEEVINNVWPLRAHESGVRCLVGSHDQQVLYSGGRDGFVKKVLTLTGLVEYEWKADGNGMITSMVLLHNHIELLVSVSSGHLYLLDLQSLEPRGRISDQYDCIINSVTVTASNQSHRIWSLDHRGRLRCIYVVPEEVQRCLVEYPEHAPPEQVRAQDRLVQMRETILRNDDILQKHRDQLTAMRVVRAFQDRATSQFLSKHDAQILRNRYFKKYLIWGYMQRYLRVRHRISNVLANTRKTQVLNKFFHQAQIFAANSRRIKYREKMAFVLSHQTKRAQAQGFIQRCIQTAWTSHVGKRKYNLAKILSHYRTESHLLLCFYVRWQVGIVRKRCNRIFDRVLTTVRNQAERNILVHGINKIIAYGHTHKSTLQRKVSSEVLYRAARLRHAHSYLLDWVRYARERRWIEAERKAVDLERKLTMFSVPHVSSSLEHQSSVSNALGHVETLQDLQDKAQEIDTRITYLQRSITEERVSDEEDLKRREARALRRKAELEKELAVAETTTRLAEYRRQLLEIDLGRFPMDTSLTAQCHSVLLELKAKGLLCGAHEGRLHEIRSVYPPADSAPSVESPVSKSFRKRAISSVSGTFVRSQDIQADEASSKVCYTQIQLGMTRVRASIKDFLGVQQLPLGGRWPLQRKCDICTNFTLDQIHNAALGIQDIIFAWDALNNRAVSTQPIEVCMREIVDNRDHLNDLVEREMQRPLPTRVLNLEAASSTFVHCTTPVLITTLDERGKRTVPETARNVRIVTRVEASSPKNKIPRSGSPKSLSSPTSPTHATCMDIPIEQGYGRAPLIFQKVGSYIVEAQYDGIRVQAPMIVEAIPKLKLTAPKRALGGSTVTITVEATNDAGQILPCQSTVHLSLDNMKGEVESIEMVDGVAEFTWIAPTNTRKLVNVEVFMPTSRSTAKEVAKIEIAPEIAANKKRITATRR